MDRRPLVAVTYPVDGEFTEITMSILGPVADVAWDRPGSA